MFNGTILEAIGYLFILALFFGIPAALIIYGIALAIKSGLRPGASQELEKRIPPELETPAGEAHSERQKEKRRAA